ncbi:MAG: MFS transporter [Nocardioides sp.]|uniref:MFS transporter n=1 Tax=Nocardioides sp. TaxID=35761 RepID=UPI003F023A39
MTTPATGEPDTGAGLDEDTVAAVQRRTVRVLVLAQSLGAIGITVGVSTAALLAKEVSGSATFAGFVQTAQVFGASVASYLLARLMARRGRRVGQVTGLLAGAAGAALAVLAGAIGSTVLLLVGALVLGGTTAANAAARYAATDLAPAHAKGRALSVVVWATTIGAVAGPNLSGPAGRLAEGLGLPYLTGPFLMGAVVMLVASVVVATAMHPDPLLLAQRLDAEQSAGQDDPADSGSTWSRAWAAMRDQPALGAAVAGQALAHAVMVAVMVMTPLHMEHGGSQLEIIGVVISLHVLGMYAFSPLIGWLGDRFGRARCLAVGALVLLGSLVLCGVAPYGHSWQITVGLFALGVGWSFSTLAAAATVAERAPVAVRTDVQGVSDMVMGLTAAAGGAASGILVSWLGFGGLAAVSAVFAAGVLGCAVVVGRHAPQ